MRQFHDYRPEIDGLRAIAVLSVIFFHAEFPMIYGGFIGVDIFFVISGYLITGMILSNMEAGTFQLGQFYKRRFLRLLPALLFVLSATAPFIILYFSNTALKDYFQSVSAIAGGYSNILFWRENSYFDGTSELKPFLHTWSLAVEEQFYLLFPIFLILTAKLSRRALVCCLFFVLLFSLGMSEWASQNKPTASFFLLPTRGWEILIGSLCAFAPSTLLSRSPKLFCEAVSLGGLFCILWSFHYFHDEMVIPGFIALIPTLGTAAILLFAKKTTIIRGFLTLKPLTFIGLISYSAYLWHQPIFAIFRTRFEFSVSSSSTTYFLLIILVLILAFISWKFVELPFRNGKILNSNVIPTALLILLFQFCLGLILSNNFQKNELARSGDDSINVEEKFRGIHFEGKNCSFPFITHQPCIITGTSEKNRTIVIIGDSHARILSGALYERVGLYSELIDLTASGCPFLIDMSIRHGKSFTECNQEYQQRRLKYVESLNFQNLVFILYSRTASYYHEHHFKNNFGYKERGKKYIAEMPQQPKHERRRHFEASLKKTLEKLKAKGKLIYVLDGPENGWDPVEIVRLKGSHFSKNEIIKLLTLERATSEKWREPILQIADGLVKEESIIDPYEIICSSDYCLGMNESQFNFADSNHVSNSVSRQIVDRIEKLLN